MVTFKHKNIEKIGVLCPSGTGVCPISAFGLGYRNMPELIRNITKAEEDVLKNSRVKGIAMGDIKLLSPIPRPARDVICLGLNFHEHAQESSRYKKESFDKFSGHAVYFSKRVSEATAPEGIIPAYTGLVDSLDYEVELGVIIKKDCFKVDKAHAFDYVFGYTIINDISARNLQTRHGQWFFGKSLDGFLPMGPCIVTKDEFDTPPILKISSRVNGELRQEGSTADMIFGIDHVISELSSGMTLKSGTIISMGTPSGVGMGFSPPKFLKPNDVVECEIEGIGRLRNTVF